MIYSNHNLTFNLQSRGGSAAFALKLDICSILPKNDLCPAEAAVDGPVRPPQYLTVKGPQSGASGPTLPRSGHG